MNEKEIAEIRRRFKPQKNNISHICGCYVSDKREIVSKFDQSLNFMPEDEMENMLGTLKKTLSGTLGRNLTDISFDTQQVVDSQEHRLLMALRSTALKDEEVVQSFFEKIIEAVDIEGNYLVLLAHDSYDIPFRGKDGGSLEDASSEVFNYILCSICPVKTTKSALSYDVPENLFRNCKLDWLVGAPELGFLFPAFDDRSSNIYGALYYSKNTGENHQGFADIIFNRELPMPPKQQKETFQTVLENSLLQDCSYDVLQSVHEQLCGIIEEHKVNKVPEPLTLTKSAVKRVLESCGVQEQAVESFDQEFDNQFGENTQLSPKNIVDNKRFCVNTPHVTINVNPEGSSLVETRLIDGKRYILIRAEDGVEVNGVSVHIKDEEEEGENE